MDLLRLVRLDNFKSNGEYQQLVDVGLIHVIKAAGYLPWIVLSSSFVIWALVLGSCYLSSGVLSPVSCWVQMWDYCHQATTSSNLSLSRECIGRAHKMPPCVLRAVRGTATQSQSTHLSVFQLSKAIYRMNIPLIQA